VCGRRQEAIRKNESILNSLAAVIQKINAMQPAIAKRLCTPDIVFFVRRGFALFINFAFYRYSKPSESYFLIHLPTFAYGVWINALLQPLSKLLDACFVGCHVHPNASAKDFPIGILFASNLQIATGVD